MLSLAVLASKMGSERSSVLTSTPPLELASEQTATLGFAPAEAHACALLLAVLSPVTLMLRLARTSVPTVTAALVRA